MIDAASYGRALFQLAEENGCGDGVLEELQLVRRALRENPGYVTLMDTPAVAGPEKHALLLQAFSGASQELRNFLCLLCDRRALWQLPACLTAYEAAYDEAHGILRATAITAVPMQQRQREALCARPAAPIPRCSAALPCAMAASSSTTASAAVWSACAAA